MSEIKRDVDLTDVEFIHRMKYAQVLRRKLSGFINFGISFTIISIFSGVLTAHYTGFSDGGPIVMSRGWRLVSLMCLFVMFFLAERASARPTTGGPYYRNAKIGSPARGWFTGRLNIIRFSAATAATAAAAATGWGAAVFTVAPGNSLLPGMAHTATGIIFSFCSVILITVGIISAFGMSLIGFVNNLSAWEAAYGRPGSTLRAAGARRA